MKGGLLIILAVLVFTPLAGRASTVRMQHVTLIGDSVADGIAGDAKARTMLGSDLDLDLEVAPCRRLNQDSCPIDGVRPPTLLQLAATMGSKLGPNVVVAVGYNDFEDEYAANIETVLGVLKAAGVKRVWWLTLRAAHHPYINMNADIVAAAQKHPELEVIDWNLYSRSHPEWFQNDGVHLLSAGSEAMAGLIHQQLVTDGIAPKPVSVVTAALPIARRGNAYRANLVSTNGLPPYRWSLLERAPRGLRLLAGGKIVGRPNTAAGRYTFNVRVWDSDGSTATRRLTLRIRP